MPLSDLHEDRDVRTKALLLGHIRLGRFTGRHPQQTETFVFTSTDRMRLEPLAEDFGGKVEAYTPQGAGTDRWRLISDTDAFTALFPFPDERNVQQDWMLWKRSGLQRKCDGFTCTVFTVDEESGEIESEPSACICAAQELRECAPETRVRLLMPQTGLGIWEMTTHSKIGAVELYDQFQFVMSAANGRVNHVPIRVVYAPREISYFDEKERKRRTTTKRLVMLSVAGDAVSVLQGLQMEPNRALLAAVEKTLNDAGRELGAASTAKALEAGSGDSSPNEDPREPATSDAVKPGESAEEDPPPAPSSPGDAAGPSTPEQWKRAAEAGFTARKAVAVAKGLGIDVRTATDLDEAQFEQAFEAWKKANR